MLTPNSMGPEGKPPIPANDNFSEYSERQLEAELDRFREGIDRIMSYPDAQAELADALQTMRVYLDSPDPKRAVVEQLDARIREASDRVTAASTTFPTNASSSSVDTLFNDIQHFYDTHPE